MFKRILSVVITFVILLSLCSCMGNNIATVNGEKIENGYFDYYFKLLKTQLENQLGEDSWETAIYEGKTALEYAKERALQSAIEDLVVTKKAEEDKITLTADDKKNMQQVKSQWISHYGSESKFLKQLKEYGINEEQFDYMMKATYYKDHLVENYTDVSEDEILDYYNQKIVKVKHILVFTIDPETNKPLDNSGINAAKNQAQRIWEMAKDGQDFDALVAEYTDDQDLFYYISEGFSIDQNGDESVRMVSEFETAALALGVGEVSDIVQTQYGYHIIKRYENDNEMYVKAKKMLEQKVSDKKFSEILDDWKSNMKIVVNESIYSSYK